MNRMEKYPETKTFHYYNANPKGRITGDCCFRAMAVALNQDYNETLKEMVEVMCKTGYALNDTKGVEAYFKTKGIAKMKQPRKSDGTKYTCGEFCETIAKKGKRYFICVANHFIAVVDKKAWDIWNSTGKTVGNYYEMP